MRLVHGHREGKRNLCSAFAKNIVNEQISLFYITRDNFECDIGPEEIASRGAYAYYYGAMVADDHSA